MTDVWTFSGTHPFHPTVLADTDAYAEGTAEDIVWDIEHGRCPRCEGPLPAMPECPAGSRISRCRSIPICGRCGQDEAYETMDAMDGRGWGMSSAGMWPLPIEEIDERPARHEQQMKSAILSPTTGRVIDENGSTPVVGPVFNADGWAQYGKEGTTP